LCLFGRQLIKLIGDLEVLVIRKQIPDAHLCSDAAAGSGVDLRARAGLLLIRLDRGRLLRNGAKS
jgi:hypothetical protein